MSQQSDFLNFSNSEQDSSGLSSLQQQLIKIQQQQQQQPLLIQPQHQNVGTINQNRTSLPVNNVNRGTVFLPQTQHSLVNNPQALLLSQLQQQQQQQSIPPNLLLQQQLQKLQQQQLLQQQQQQAMLGAPNTSMANPSPTNFVTNNVPNPSISPSPTSFANGVVSSIPTPTPSHISNTPLNTNNPISLSTNPAQQLPISFPPEVLAQLAAAGNLDQQKIRQLLAQKHIQKQQQTIQQQQQGGMTYSNINSNPMVNPATTALISGTTSAINPNSSNSTVILNRNNLLSNQQSGSVLQQGSAFGNIPGIQQIQQQSQQPQQQLQPQQRASTSTMNAQDQQKQLAYKADYFTPFQGIEDIRNRLQVYQSLQYQPPNDNWDAKINAVATKFMKYPHAIRDYVNKKLNDQKKTEQDIFVLKFLVKDEREALENEKLLELQRQQQHQQQQQQQGIDQTFEMPDPMQGGGFIDFQQTTDNTSEFLDFDSDLLQ